MQDSTYRAFLNLGVLSCVDFSVSFLKHAHFFQWNSLGFWTTKTSKSAHSPWLHSEKSFANFSFLRIWHSRSSTAVIDELVKVPKDLSTISTIITDFQAELCIIVQLFALLYLAYDLPDVIPISAFVHYLAMWKAGGGLGWHFPRYQ